MVRVHLKSGEIRDHESVEIQGGFLFVYDVEEDDYVSSVERIYPLSNVQEIEPEGEKIQGAPTPGDGILVVPDE